MLSTGYAGVGTLKCRCKPINKLTSVGETEGALVGLRNGASVGLLVGPYFTIFNDRRISNTIREGDITFAIVRPKK